MLCHRQRTVEFRLPASIPAPGSRYHPSFPNLMRVLDALNAAAVMPPISTKRSINVNLLLQICMILLLSFLTMPTPPSGSDEMNTNKETTA